MNIVIGTLVLMALAAWAWRKLETGAARDQALQGVRSMVITNLPRVVLALISAGLFADLLPETLVRQYIGDTSGFTGVVIGMGLGIFTPGGAFVSFALAAGALQAGATAPAIVAYISAWGLFALTKIIAEELAFLGPRFLFTRVILSCPIPLLTGGVALIFLR
ncbi:hypothetical protein J7443_07855 [Tropicibacter sp. R15_0]|uniref:hypothetical protein n=1 Tax=Tropicibacter sp. R15_0 TaxID=2821101 RepID=UPI001AD9FED9|nr:hypothetical protein [Tropicibacter sp. R15_0]MBO9465137.1 hypothetical protein [Tropicibacter sp. R15_0]